jgi:hypothetical protein
MGWLRRGRDTAAAAGVLWWGLLGTGCLPGDERPEPGSLFVTAEPSEATAAGFVTPDGWTIRFDRFVTAVGQLRLSEDSCNAYGEARYAWLFDFAVAEREKVGLVYGLGTCSLEFDFRPPSFNSPLGPGVTEQDRELMGRTGSDAYTTDQRVAVIVRGQAQRAGETKRFDWTFRHRYELTRCAADEGATSPSTVEFRAGERVTRQIVVRAEELFRRAAEDDAPFHFDPLTTADADGDGSITIGELNEVDAPPDDNGEAPDETDDGTPLSLADLIYRRLLPRVLYLAGGGTCEAELEN